MKAGDVFDLSDFAGGHPNFVLEVFADESVITCNFSDYNQKCDKTCVVEVNEHECIKKKSVVYYRKAHHCQAGTPLEALERLIKRRYTSPLGEALLARIRQGALDSPQTADDIKTALKEKK